MGYDLHKKWCLKAFNDGHTVILLIGFAEIYLFLFFALFGTLFFAFY